MATAIVLGAVSSGSGKTTVTLGLIAALRARGLTVQSFKVGPDYIDTAYHSIAAERPSHNLDSWLIPIDKLRAIFESSLGDADVAIIEGVMGLYDGGRGGISSTAEIAKLLGIPVVLIIDAKSIGASAAAIALGFREFDRDVNLVGVILNRIGSSTHQKMIEDALGSIDMKCFGALRRDRQFTIPERHLGLLLPTENSEFTFLNELRAAIEAQIDLDALLEATVSIEPKIVETKKSRSAFKIGVAKDEAFSFYYPASFVELERRGAEIVEFSPLHDAKLPPVDALLLGGGYPEMFASELEANSSMREEIRRAASEGMPIFAECGGYMYLMRELIGFDGRHFEMCGVLSSRAAMNDRLQMVGYVDAELLADCMLGRRGERLHAHEFHFSNVIDDDPSAMKIFRCTRLRTGEIYEAGVIKNNVVGSYLHFHFAGCPHLFYREFN